jgi:hypothetical protein
MQFGSRLPKTLLIPRREFGARSDRQPASPFRALWLLR